MTCREKLFKERPDLISHDDWGGCFGCPDDYGYLEKPEVCSINPKVENNDEVCRKCWDREIPNNEPESNTRFDIYALIDDAMQKRDRSVTIYIHPKNGMSVAIYPWPDEE